MLDHMSWEQLSMWIAYADLEPFDENRADLRAGQIAMMIGNAHRDPKKGKPFKATDFMVYLDGGPDRKAGPREPLTSADDWKKVKDMARALNTKAN